MGKTKINTYVAILLIAVVGLGAFLMIMDAASKAKMNSDAYYAVMNAKGFGTTTPAGGVGQ